MCSYGPTEAHLWLVGKIVPRTWEDCRSTSERERRTHTYDDLVDLFIQRAKERENDSTMENFFKRHLWRCAKPTSDRGESRGYKTPTNPSKGRDKGGG